MSTDNIVHLPKGKKKNKGPYPWVQTDGVAEDATVLRHQLLANGYVPIPAYDKRTMFTGWNAGVVDVAMIGSWVKNPRATRYMYTGTGLRIEGGLMTLDIDVPDKGMAVAVRAIIEEVAPHIIKHALERGRDDGSPKVMFFMRRAGEPFSRKSRKWHIGEDTALIEVFASERNDHGKVRRQVGAFGPHTVDEEGHVVRRYEWKGLSPRDVAIVDLPEATEEQAIAIIERFDALAESMGLAVVEGSKAGRTQPRDVYDLDEGTRVSGDDFTEITIAELADIYWGNMAHGISTRCYDLVDGFDPKAREDRCHVGWTSAKRADGYITIHDYAEEVTHRPVGASPPEGDLHAVYAEALAAYDRAQPQPATNDVRGERENTAIAIAIRGSLGENGLARAVEVVLDHKFCYDGYDWRRFDGTVWAEAMKHAIEHEFGEFVVKTLSPILPRDAGGVRERKRLTAAKTAAAVERILRPMLYKDPKLFDANPYLIAAGDEVVDIKTGEARPGQPEDMLSKRCPVAPSDHEDCPLWLRFLDQAMQGDRDKVRFLQQWAGMGLCGTPLHQKLAYFHGAGGNGKNVFIDTIHAVFGQYAHIADISLLTATRGDKHPTGTWALKGKRTALMSEPDENATWDTAKVKSLTGDGSVTAHRMHHDDETFPRTWTMTVVGNNKPHLKHVDDALRRRILLVPFEYSVPKEERDEELVAKLVGEAAGILRWAINGYIDVRANRLIEPKAIVDATMDYLKSEDIVGSFVADEVVAKPGAVTTHKEMFERWKAYAATAGADAGYPARLSERMQPLLPGVRYDRKGPGMAWFDIELQSVDWSRHV